MLFWDVDTQVDFLLPGGRLYVPGAELIISNLSRLTRYARDHRVSVISSACAHRPGDSELQTYGQHCMAGTPGQQKIAETLLPNRCTLPNRGVALPKLRCFQQVILEKQRFDVFTNPNTDKAISQFGRGLSIFVYGVTTDICVAHAANALLGRGHNVTILIDAVAALDARKAAEFLAEFCKRGGHVQTLQEVLKQTRAA